MRRRILPPADARKQPTTATPARSLRRHATAGASCSANGNISRQSPFAAASAGQSSAGKTVSHCSLVLALLNGISAVAARTSRAHGHPPSHAAAPSRAASVAAAPPLRRYGCLFQYSSAGPLITSKRSSAARARTEADSSAVIGRKLCAMRTSSSSWPCVVKPSTAAVTGRLSV